MPYLEVTPLVVEVAKLVVASAHALFDQVGLGARQLLLNLFLSQLGAVLCVLNPGAGKQALRVKVCEGLGSKVAEGGGSGRTGLQESCRQGW